MFCVECGKEAARLVDSVCGSCWIAKHKPAGLVAEMSLALCYRCNAALRGKVWQEPSSERGPVVEREVRRLVWLDKKLEEPRVEPVAAFRDDHNAQCDVHVEGRVAGVPFESILTTTVHLKSGVCTACSRQSGGYWASLVQIRATDRDPTERELERAYGILVELLEAAWRKGNRNAFVSKEGAVRGGYDVYLGDIDVGRQAARALAEEFNTRPEESSTLMGEKEGKSVYRVTYLVRIPPYKRDDILVTEGGPMLVTNVHPKSVSVIRLWDGQHATLDRMQAAKAKVLVAGEHVKEVLIVSVTPDEALVLDQRTNKTHEVKLPAQFDYKMGRTTLHAVKVDDQFYVVPLRAAGSPPGA